MNNGTDLGLPDSNVGVQGVVNPQVRSSNAVPGGLSYRDALEQAFDASDLEILYATEKDINTRLAALRTVIRAKETALLTYKVGDVVIHSDQVRDPNGERWGTYITQDIEARIVRATPGSGTGSYRVVHRVKSGDWGKREYSVYGTNQLRRP